MIAVDIKEVRIRKIKMPLKSPFITRLETVVEREGIIVEVEASDRTIGYGEVVAFSSPWYTEETVSSAWAMLVEFLIPILKKHDISHPSQFVQETKWIKRNWMAKAGLEMALWDLWSKQKQQSLASFFGGNRHQIPAGLVVASNQINDILTKIEEAERKGYKRVKLKISRSNDIEILREVRHFFPKMSIMADANGGYTLDDLEHLRELDSFGLTLLEQPFSEASWYEHAELQKNMATPICLDESIYGLEDVKQAIRFGSARSVCVKIGKFGWMEAKAIYDLCLKNGLTPWVGGMIEFGISRAHSIALASLQGFTIPGDISETSRYWEQDITSPEVEIVKGSIELPTGAGIGFEVDQQRLNDVTNECISFSI